MFIFLTREMVHSNRITPFGYPVLVTAAYVAVAFFTVVIVPNVL